MGTCLRVPYTWNMVIHVTHVLKMFFKNLYCMNINKVHFFTCFKCWYFYFLTTHTHFNQEPGISAICNCAYHHMKIFQQNSKWKTLRYGQYRQGLFFFRNPCKFWSSRKKLNPGSSRISRNRTFLKRKENVRVRKNIVFLTDQSNEIIAM